MKKLIAILLITIYAGSAIGWAINFHYCGDHLAKVSVLNFEAKKSCACNPEDMPKDCCKDELQYEKSDNHKTVQQFSIWDLTSFPIEQPATNNYYLSLVQEGYSADFIKDGFLRSHPYPVYLLNRVFRI